MKELCSFLVTRGYVREHVRREIDRARRIPSEEVIKDKVRNNNKRIRFVVILHPELPNMATILHRLHPVLQSSRRCRDAIEQVPMVAFRGQKSLTDMLVHSKLINKTAGGIRGCVRCGERRCKVCDFLVEGTDFKSNDTDSNLT